MCYFLKDVDAHIVLFQKSTFLQKLEFLISLLAKPSKEMRAGILYNISYHPIKTLNI